MTLSGERALKALDAVRSAVREANVQFRRVDAADMPGHTLRKLHQDMAQLDKEITELRWVVPRAVPDQRREPPPKGSVALADADAAPLKRRRLWDRA